MRVGDIGEFGLIKRLAGMLPCKGDPVVVGIGDDVAVLKPSNKYFLATCDIHVEGIHFSRERISPKQLGQKVVAINLSDIAAMGGIPLYILVSLGLPQDTEVKYVDSLYEGIHEEASRFSVAIVGGNVSGSTGGLIIDIFLIGEVEPENLVLRSRARPGDRVMVTGELGASAAGLLLLQNPGLEIPKSMAEKVKKAHFTPTPRIPEGRVIALSKVATSMIDLSDGLASDLSQICEASRVGAMIQAEHLPVSEAAIAVAELIGKDPLDLALYGGEDYELLFTAPSDEADALAIKVYKETGISVASIGEITPNFDERKVVYKDGRVEPLGAMGWNHFRMGCIYSSQ